MFDSRGQKASLTDSQNLDLKSPNLKYISHIGLIFSKCVCKLIVTSDVICNVYGLFGHDKQTI